MSDIDRQRLLDKACNALLAAFPQVWAIYVYGSFARGDHSPQSDIDLALLLPPDERIDELLSVINDVSSRGRAKHTRLPVTKSGLVY